jgi:EF hand
MRSTTRLKFLLSAGMAGVLLAALPIGLDGSTFSPVATQAWAGNGNGNGNGGGNGNANGHDKADKTNHGAEASSLGALNAAHASETALAHASPTSRVGKIAAYKEAELAAQDAEQAVADAEAALADAEAAFDAADTNDDGVIDDAEKAALTADAQAAADAAFDAADTNNDGVIDANDTSTAEQQQAAADAEAALAEAQASADTLDTAVTDAEQDFADAQAAAEDAQEMADAALVDAANKDITDESGEVFSEVRDAVNDLLGID